MLGGNKSSFKANRIGANRSSNGMKMVRSDEWDNNKESRPMKFRKRKELKIKPHRFNDVD